MKNATCHLTIILAITICMASGQTDRYYVGVEGGPSLISMRGNEIIDISHSATSGFSAGFSFQYNLNKHLSFRSGVSLEKKGSAFNYDGQNRDGSWHHVRSSHNFHYLTVPLLMRASIDRKIKLFINGGPFIGILTGKTVAVKKNDLHRKEYQGKASYKTFDLGVTAGLGLLVPCNNNVLISFEVRNNYGLSNIYKFEPLRTNSLNFLIGVVLPFGRNT